VPSPAGLKKGLKDESVAVVTNLFNWHSLAEEGFFV
jgi:hypothetical protein